MDRALVAVLGGAVSCGVLLAVAVAKNERGFTQRLYAANPPVVETSKLEPASRPGGAGQASPAGTSADRARPLHHEAYQQAGDHRRHSAAALPPR